MRLERILQDITDLAIDTAPIIYYVENHPTYADKVQVIVDFADKQLLKITGSNLLLTEVLVQPIKIGDKSLIDAYKNILLNGFGFELREINADIAIKAAELRAKYKLKTPDALHVATAIVSGANAFLTNDKGFKRVTDINILILDDLEI